MSNKPNDEEFNIDSKAKSLWIIAVGLVPIIIASVNYIIHPNKLSELFVATAFIFGAFSFLLSKIETLRHVLENVSKKVEETDSKIFELVGPRLLHPEMRSCMKLSRAFSEILDYENPNPLMIELADCQIAGLTRFLSGFNGSLYFFPEYELISIQKHFSIFMDKIRKGGSYIASTFVQFWYDEDDEIVNNFFSSNCVAARKGIKIRRVFIVSNKDKEHSRTFDILKKHDAISITFGNKGQIETKVLETDILNNPLIDYNNDDFGIYFMDGKPMAIAIAKFYTHSSKLKGNEVSFNPSFMEDKIEVFEERFKRAVDIKEYLENNKVYMEGSGIELDKLKK